jgi:chromosome partitioning protein
MEPLQSRLESRYKIYKLREALDSLQGFERIYIDTPPVLNFYSRSGLIAAKQCLIPFDCDAFSREALYNLLATIAEIRADHNAELNIEGIIVNQFQGRANLPQQLVNELIQEGHPVLESKISPSVKVRESHSESKPLIHYAPDHKLTEEFVALHQELHGEG